MTNILECLAAEYPQLYLNPDTEPQEIYRRVVLRGEEPERKNLDHYRGDPGDRDEMVDTPTGKVRVVTLGNRRDFELVMRSLLGAKTDPLKPIPESQGAAMVTVFNWPRIHAHLEQFPEEERDAELKRFTTVKENYIDVLVVLSRGPYSHVDAATAGVGEAEWLDLSDVIRRNHELSHVICRRNYPKDVAPIRDELVADAVGLYAAFGRFDPELERHFLGIREMKYTGGRLGNYTNQPEKITESVCAALERIQAAIEANHGAQPFDLIPALMAAADIGETQISQN